MTVKNENIETKQEEIQDDLDDSLNEDKLAALKAKMAKKQEEPKEEAMPPKIIEEKKKSLRFGVIGSGQAGSRLSSCIYNLGYPAVAVNTAAQDLAYIKLPEENKLLLEYTIGGAAKDIEVGQEAAEANRDAIATLIDDKLSDAHVYLFCTSLGGGSGSGSVLPICEILAATGKPVAVITVLPLTTDDAQTKNNALITLSKLAKMAQNKQIVNLIVVDNARIETIYSDVSQMDFFDVSNNAIVEPIDVFNKFSALPSKVKSLDSMEFAKLFTDGEGLTVYGEINVHGYEEETAVAEAVIESLNSNLLASGFDLKQTRYGGVLIVGHPEVMNAIPRGSIGYAMSLIKETCVSADAIYHGIYEDESYEKDVLKIYTMFSGLGLPSSRIEQLKKEVQEELAKAKERDQTHNLNLQLDTGVEEATSQADKVRQMIKKKGSTFGKNFAGGLKDFRKK